ncbi:MULTISPECIES: hypoxanthine phosphoribosyltransferase [unclassified Imperialibacter]|uniref:hypoxanthine phosphoribosyltransferase n=1 Tax=unclassified Imperialibacter TaxID=2629706 RepID=UPI001250D629|nr:MULTISPECIES: hypoxanthine phosphoribosyltransferase [unclassified Imperialibacter]CAD5246846.1 Hypoxanthine phosphoribosyltransferase [Imperialibacter sp. 75]CAD5246913.1 Hypoxanthine phosphoribosyltransferase [Imperialibacter sp. 89]VVS96511.1 Hypoxanthine phosphoribosyltransferase [Imperialibacter sp. EC-SDR9]
MMINNKEFEHYIDRSQISNRLNELAEQIDTDYTGKSVVMLAVLNGAFIFAGDLIRLLKVDAEVSFVKLKSYRGLASSGEVQTLIGLMHELKDREVLIVEDIIDTGRTMSKLLEMVWEQSPASVKVCTLLVKPDVFKSKYPLDYVGFSIPDKFVVGYGLDYDELGRQLPDIYKIKD